MIRTILAYFILGIGAYFVIFDFGNVYGIIILLLGLLGVTGDFVTRKRKNNVN